MKTIGRSTSKFVTRNHTVIMNWINNLVHGLDKKTACEFVCITDTNNRGCLYVVDSKRMPDAIKLGFWTGGIDKLITRYSTYYGNDFEITYFECEHPRLAERELFSEFKEYRRYGEHFDKKHKQDYIDYLKNKYNGYNVYGCVNS